MNRKLMCFFSLVLAFLAAFSLVSCNRVEDGTYFCDAEGLIFEFDGNKLYITYAVYHGATVEAECSYKIRDGYFYISVKDVEVYTYGNIGDYEEIFENRIIEDFNGVKFDWNDRGFYAGGHIFVSH